MVKERARLVNGVDLSIICRGRAVVVRVECGLIDKLYDKNVDIQNTLIKKVEFYFVEPLPVGSFLSASSSAVV